MFNGTGVEDWHQSTRLLPPAAVRMHLPVSFLQKNITSQCAFWHPFISLCHPIKNKIWTRPCLSKSWLSLNPTCFWCITLHFLRLKWICQWMQDHPLNWMLLKIKNRPIYWLDDIFGWICVFSLCCHQQLGLQTYFSLAWFAHRHPCVSLCC